jgi:hypothetical protein
MFKAVPDHLPGQRESQIKRVAAASELFKKAISADGCAGCMATEKFRQEEDLLSQYGSLRKKAANAADYYTNDFLK